MEGKLVCESIGKTPELVPEINCPSHCKNDVKFLKDEFTIDDNGNLQIINDIHKVLSYETCNKISRDT